jgi:hypothetical protein
VVTSNCGAEETHIQKMCSFCSILSSMEGQGDIHYNIVEAFVSNVMSVGMGVKCERKIVF